MKEFSLLIWLTQLGISVAAPLAVLVLLAVWLHRSCGWGQWTIWVGLVVGFICAIQGFRDSLKIMEQVSREKKKEDPGVSFNEHN